MASPMLKVIPVLLLVLEIQVSLNPDPTVSAGPQSWVQVPPDISGVPGDVSQVVKSHQLCHFFSSVLASSAGHYLTLQPVCPVDTSATFHFPPGTATRHWRLWGAEQSNRLWQRYGEHMYLYTLSVGYPILLLLPIWKFSAKQFFLLAFSVHFPSTSPFISMTWSDLAMEGKAMGQTQHHTTLGITPPSPGPSLCDCSRFVSPGPEGGGVLAEEACKPHCLPNFQCLKAYPIRPSNTCAWHFLIPRDEQDLGSCYN